MASAHLAHEKFWSNKAECEDAEARYYAKLYGKSATTEKAVEKAENSDEVDLFASDDEPVEKPPLKKVEKTKPPPSKAEKKADKKSSAVKENKPAQKQQSGQKAAAAPAKKAAEAADKQQPAAPAAKEKNEAAAASSSSGLEGESLYQNAANGQRSFIMLKPDAVHRGLVGEIVARFERKGFKMVAMKFMQASQELLKNHYSDLSKKPFFPELIRYMSSGPVVPMVWEGVNVVKTGRMMLGETNPKDSLPGTIRGDYCVDVGRNIIHGSDSVESAKREIAMWFSQSELPKWRPVAIPWIYENEDIETAVAASPAAATTSPAKVDGLAALTSAGTMELQTKLTSLEKENKTLKKVTDDLKALVLKLEGRVSQLEKSGGSSAPAAPAKEEEDDDDEEVDLFGSDSEEEEESADKVRIREERLKAYAEKKSKKPALIAKTSVLLDIKPWDDETDMDAMLKAAKTIEKEGLVWGAHKLVPVGYGINKLQLMCVVEDEKVSIDELCEQISEFEDFVQSVDISAMSKI